MSAVVTAFIAVISKFFVKSFSLSRICDIKKEVFMISGG